MKHGCKIAFRELRKSKIETRDTSFVVSRRYRLGPR
jgi:hypothetical protein